MIELARRQLAQGPEGSGREAWDLLAAIDVPEPIAHVFDHEEVCAQAAAWLELCERMPNAAKLHAWFLYHCARSAAVTDPERSRRCLAAVAQEFASRGELVAQALARCALLEIETCAAPALARGRAWLTDAKGRRELQQQVRTALSEKTSPIRLRLGAAALDCGVLASDGASESEIVAELDAQLHNLEASLATIDWCVASADWHVRHSGALSAAEALLRQALRSAAALHARSGVARVQNLLAAVLMARGSTVWPPTAAALLHPSHRLDDLRRANLAGLKALFLGQAPDQVTRRAAALEVSVDRQSLGTSVFGPVDYRIAVASVCAEAGMHSLARAWLDGATFDVLGIGNAVLVDAALLLRGWELAASGREAEAVEAVQAPLMRHAARGQLALFPYAPKVAATLVGLGVLAGANGPWLREIVARQGLRAPDDTSPAWPWSIRAHVLGTPEVYLGGERVQVAGKMQQRVWELLCVLAAAGPQGKSQQFVARQLWGTSEAPEGALRVAIHRLRKLLGSDEAVMVRNGMVMLNSELVWTDLQALQNLCDRIVDRREHTLVSHVRSKVDHLLRLYRGGMFCADSLSWVLAVQRKVFMRFMAAASLLAEQLEAHGDWSGASRIYRRMLDPEPLSETAYRGLMRCATAQGDMATAFSHYRFCRDTLAIVLGRDVSPDTRCLAEDLGFLQPNGPALS
ncbi:BTAD domain-containing putative transcriptional regulator [Variovorax sp. JS1663]|uniref:BTAD domain-containing putative transcriptional regulator n=1 Tax=Variovorax sp. JS1663 TaxID=1851577 RepID=UPI000B63870E|nr:BTAD domain-containing putative transcriptional regulator [Variovorax sp. JS1663]OUL98315.1 hypothetical protein A8M77_32120 [Variovorax sp. JS1663]